MSRRGPGGWHGWDPGAGQPGWEWQRYGRRLFLRAALTMAVAVLLLALVVGGLIALVANLDLRTVVIALLLLIGILAVVGRMVGRGLGRTWGPVRRLIEGLGALADGDYSARVPDAAAGPIRPVVLSFNETARRLEESDEQRRRLLADLGHELRTPLTVVRGEVEAMLDGVHPSDPDHLEVLLDEVTVLERLIEDLRTLSLAEAGALTLHREPTDLGALVGDVADAHRRSAAAAGIDIEEDVADGGGDVDGRPGPDEGGGHQPGRQRHPGDAAWGTVVARGEEQRSLHLDRGRRHGHRHPRRGARPGVRALPEEPAVARLGAGPHHQPRPGPRPRRDHPHHQHGGRRHRGPGGHPDRWAADRTAAAEMTEPLHFLRSGMASPGRVVVAFG